MTGTGAGQAPGVVKLRISGASEDIDVLAGLLGAVAAVEVIDQSGSNANRRDPGERVYLAVRVTTPERGSR